MQAAPSAFKYDKNLSFQGLLNKTAMIMCIELQAKLSESSLI